MTQIPTNQGAIKQSEVAIDTAQNIFGTLDREDGLTLVNQIRNVSANLLRKTSFLLISDGVISWTGTIVANNGNNILLKFNQNPGAGVITVTIPTSVLATFPIGNMQVLYFKCSRSALAASFTATGSNFAVSTEGAMPAMASPQSDATEDPTIFVPLLARYDVGSNQSAWWVPHGIYWPQNTTSVVGSIITGTTLPNGTIIPMNRPGGTYPLGTPGLLAQETGWALCDGAVIVDLQSPYNNTGRDADGFPNVTYSSANDRFAPTLNGTAPAWITATNYVRGDAVTNAGATLLWVALSSFTAGTGSGWDPNAALPATWSAVSSYIIGDFVVHTEPSVNGSGQPVTIIYRALAANGPTAVTPYSQGTSVWQRIWATDPTQNGNPFKRSGLNSSSVSPANTYIRGSYTSPNSSGAYGGANTVALSISQMPRHRHGSANDTDNSAVAGAAATFNSAVTTGTTGSGHRHAFRIFNDYGGNTTGFAAGDNANAEVINHSLAPDHYSNTPPHPALAADGTHTHNVPSANLNAAQSNHVHTIGFSGGTVGSNSAGDGLPHNNEPRYLSTPYIIKIY